MRRAAAGAKGSAPRTPYQSGKGDLAAARRAVRAATVSATPRRLGARRWARWAYLRAELRPLEVLNLDSASDLRRRASCSSRSVVAAIDSLLLLLLLMLRLRKCGIGGNGCFCSAGVLDLGGCKWKWSAPQWQQQSPAKPSIF